MASLHRSTLVLGGMALVLAAGVLTAQPGTTPTTPTTPTTRGASESHQAGQHVLINAQDLKWADGPPGLPSGARMAVLQGDPGKSGLFTIRLKFPAGYKVPAHHHPVDEHVTVISGKFSMGMGDKLDTAKGTALAQDGFAVMPAGMKHFAWADEETIIQIHAMGPFEITYVNPADDPRSKDGTAPPKK